MRTSILDVIRIYNPWGWTNHSCFFFSFRSKGISWSKLNDDTYVKSTVSNRDFCHSTPLHDGLPRELVAIDPWTQNDPTTCRDLDIVCWASVQNTRKGTSTWIQKFWRVSTSTYRNIIKSEKCPWFNFTWNGSVALFHHSEFPAIFTQVTLLEKVSDMFRKQHLKSLIMVFRFHLPLSTWKIHHSPKGRRWSSWNWCRTRCTSPPTWKTGFL